MVECQVVGNIETHGGRLASWIAEWTGMYFRLVLCERHARGLRVVGVKIREEN